MNLKQFIFKTLEDNGYVLDNEISKFLGKEPNFFTVEKYKKDWFNLKNAKDYFSELENNPNTIIRKSNRKYLIRDKTWDNFYWKVIPKIYFEYLAGKGVNVLLSP